jgi:cyclophilin family peptidyl-prolyl cis-trans isomerase
LACRNFVQLALEGYYDNMFVHRIVKGRYFVREFRVFCV